MKLSFKYFKKYAPASLLGRAMMILILPTLIAQAVSVYMFYERHMDHIARQLSLSLSAEVITVAEYIESADSPEAKQKYLARATSLFGFSPKLMTKEQSIAHTRPLKKIKYKLYENNIRHRLGKDVSLYSDNAKVITTVVYLGNEALVIDTPYKRLINSTSSIFILWMTGITAILLLVSIFFLKNQVRPVVRLARLADNLGRGHDLSFAYKAEGASEVRQAYKAFINMQQRITRFVKQRTDMLAGISHDLRTPLTRMKLELAMLKDKTSVPAEFAGEMEKDINELESMINSYIEFARGDEAEEVSNGNLAEMLTEIAGKFKSANITINAEPIMHYNRPNAIKRAFSNIIDNALKYGKSLRINAHKTGEYAVIEFEDDGPGIPEYQREEVFKPFFRLEESRNNETGGIGLGLSIVRDVIGAHGGTVEIDNSSMGGAKFIVKLPV